MNRQILSLLVVFLLMPIVVKADSYTSLWKQYTVTKEKDLPKSSRDILAKIVSKASSEKAYGHLLKAELLTVSINTQVSPDSMAVEVQRLSALELQARERDAVLAAIYQTVLGRIYRDNRDLGEGHEQRSREYFAMALKDLDLLSQGLAADFEPFVIPGIDSKIFSNDLLHVIGFEARAYQKLHDFYLSRGNRPAACMCALLSLRQQKDDEAILVRKSKYLQRIDSLIHVYQDLPQAGELAIEHYKCLERASDATSESKINYINYALSRWGTWPRMNILRNAQSDLTQPTFNVSIGDELSIPNTPRKVLINSIRNISSLTMNLWRLNVKGDTHLNPSDEKDLQRLMSGATAVPEATQTKRYFGLPCCKVVSDSMTIIGLPVGVYLVEFTTDNNNISPQRGLLHVSDVFVMHESIADRNILFQAVSATTGKPLPGVKIRLTTTGVSAKGGGKVSEVIECGKNGEVEYRFKNRQPDMIYAYTDADEAGPELYFNSYFAYYDVRRDLQVANLFTDRKIYRPGQTVHAAVLAYINRRHEDLGVDAHKSFTLTLRDANYKVVAEKQVTTDAYGAASADFVLPSAGLTGQFSIGCNDASGARTYFSVEEYKRPTFQVTFDPVTQKYQDGDSLQVRGFAKSFAGVPVQGAHVKYVVTRRPSLWWWYRAKKDYELVVSRDSAITGQDGSFTAKFLMELPEEANGDRHPRFYHFDVEAEVTDVAGETQRSELSLPLSTRPTAFSCDLPDKIERDSLKSITFRYLNNAGEPITGQVHYSFDATDVRLQAEANRQTGIAAHVGSLSSGKHLLYAVCGTDTIQKEFVVFTMNDKHPAVSTPDWFYQSASEFPVDGKPVYIQVGSSDVDQYVFFTIHSGKKLLEKGVIEQSNAIKTRKFTYKDEYGEGILLNYFWVKAGKMYRHKAEIRKPLPDKRLILKWSTFRDRLTPGQSEEWTLSVSRPDGKKGKAHLIATLFDMSLDKIRQHNWQFEPSLYRSLPQTRWLGGNFQAVGFYGFMSYKPLTENALDFSRFDDEVFPHANTVMLYSQSDIRIRGAKPMMMAKTALGAAAPQVEMAISANDNVAMDGSGQEPKGSSTGQVRENLNETAFFYPSLISDEKGNVRIKFTLPESITTWRFMGLAHDTLMNYGWIEATSVARKDVMLQPNLPRFVRANDKSVLTARIFNASETNKEGVAKMLLIDPATGRTVMEFSKPFTVEAGQTVTAGFDFTPSQLTVLGTDASVYICRMTASGRNFSDGEQHYLPILPDRELVTTTVPVTQHGPGETTVDVAKLFPVKNRTNKLTVEYTNNPAWLMIQALPTVAQTDEKNAISLAAAFYANSVSKFILRQTPTIKTVLNSWKLQGGNGSPLQSQLQKNAELKSMLLDETPWVGDADREAEQKQLLINFFDESATDYRLHSQLTALRSLQSADGSFSWWPGMPGSLYMTTAVSKMLVRLNRMIGNSPETSAVLRSAFGFMDRRIAEIVAEMKKQEKKGAHHLCPSNVACDYLYVSALAQRSPTADIRYLIGLLEKNSTALSIYGKANSAVILSAFGKPAKAKEYLQSLSEYTVFREDIGRYFDTPKAQSSWFDYRIPTQVAAIEAIKALQPDKTGEIDEMKRWLLQEKRTQSWDTPINSVEAVYAFLDGQRPTDLAAKEEAVIRLDGTRMDLSAATAGLGYVKGSVTGKTPKTLTIDKSSDGTSWGAVYAQYFQASSAVTDHAAGFTIMRELIGADRLKVGDRVRVRITVQADRDYDFVQIVDKRAACMEPVRQLSGYHNGYYCSPRDHATSYYFDRLPKGKHVIETEYYLDRSGTYQTGTCTVQCAYSPEFMARTAAKQLVIHQ